MLDHLPRNQTAKLSYIARIDTLEKLHRLLSEMYANGHALPGSVLALLDEVEGCPGKRGDRGKVR